MTRPGADLIAWYLNPDRLPVESRWSRKHADNQRRLCQRFAVPVIGAVTCQDIKVSHAQKIVNAAPTAGEGGRVHRMLSAMVGAGIKGGYLVRPTLAEVHWQAGDRPVPAPKVTVGESALLVDPAETPSSADVGGLGRALAVGSDGERAALMANLAAYSGLRWGELAALTIGQIAQAARVITVDRKVVEVGGQLYLEPPKNRKFRRTIYPRRTPDGYPLAPPRCSLGSSTRPTCRGWRGTPTTASRLTCTSASPSGSLTAPARPRSNREQQNGHRDPRVHGGRRARRGRNRGVYLLLARLRRGPPVRRERRDRAARASHHRRPGVRVLDGHLARRAAPAAGTVAGPRDARARHCRLARGQRGPGLVPRSRWGGGGGRGRQSRWSDLTRCSPG